MTKDGYSGHHSPYTSWLPSSHRSFPDVGRSQLLPNHRKFQHLHILEAKLKSLFDTKEEEKPFLPSIRPFSFRPQDGRYINTHLLQVGAALISKTHLRQSCEFSNIAPNQGDYILTLAGLVHLVLL